MTNEIDWDNGPSTATHYGGGKFWRMHDSGNCWETECAFQWVFSNESPMSFIDYQERPQPKPKYEYGVEYPTNGQKPDLPDDVLVDVEYRWLWRYTKLVSVGDWDWKDAITAFRIVDERYKPAVATVEHKAPSTYTEYLSACAQVQSERAKQYDASGTCERSFDAAAEAFNCVTGKNLRGSDVCLILEMVKLVRQYSDPTRLHEDSVLDAVSYASLWAEELTKELR